MARAARIAGGIEIDDTTWAQLAAIAERYQIRLNGREAPCLALAPVRAVRTVLLKT
jgi:hypothetical protein